MFDICKRSITVIMCSSLFQNMAPFIVCTAMSGICRPTFPVPSAEAYVKAAIASVGIQKSTFGCFSHALQVWGHDSISCVIIIIRVSFRGRGKGSSGRHFSPPPLLMLATLSTLSTNPSFIQCLFPHSRKYWACWKTHTNLIAIGWNKENSCSIISYMLLV